MLAGEGSLLVVEPGQLGAETEKLGGGRKNATLNVYTIATI